MFITFATSNDVLKYRPHDSPGVGLHDNEQAPKFCNGLDCPKFTIVKSTKVSYHKDLCLHVSYIVILNYLNSFQVVPTENL